jgi:hypothetical protein
VDIHDFFTGRRPWAQLERLIERLPRHSRYKAALEDDDNYAALALAMQKAGVAETPARVPLVGYDEVAVRLDNIYDAVNALRETLIAIYSKRNSAKPKPNRAPRPESAHQRVRRRQAREKLDSIVDQMTGGR